MAGILPQVRAQCAAVGHSLESGAGVDATGTAPAKTETSKPDSGSGRHGAIMSQEQGRGWSGVARPFRAAKGQVCSIPAPLALLHNQ